MITDNTNEHKILDRTTLISSLGDFISFFAVLSFIYQQTNSVKLASTTVLVEVIGKLLCFLIFPKFEDKFGAKKLILFSHLTGFFNAFILIAFVAGIIPFSIEAISILYGINVLCSNLFDASKETLSKQITVPEEQHIRQSNLLAKFGSAQFIGPLLSLSLISIFGLIIPLIIDSLSFLYSFYISLKLKDQTPPLEHEDKKNIKDRVTELLTNPESRRILLLRSFGTKTYIALFNILIFSVVVEFYKLGIDYTALSYAAAGAGTIVFPYILKNYINLSNSSLLKLYKYTFIGFLTLAIIRVSYIWIPSKSALIAISFFCGIAGGTIAATTRTIRRLVCTNENFSTMVSIENILGLGTQILIKILFLFVVTKESIDYENGIFLVTAIILATSLVPLSVLIKARNKKQLIQWNREALEKAK